MTTRTPHSYRALARRYWPKAELLGAGPWATVSKCPPVVSVELHSSEEAAAATLSFIGQFGCGHACCRHHAVVDLREGGAATPVGGRP